MIIKVLKCHENAVMPTKIGGNLAFDLHVVRDKNFFEDSESKKYLCRLMPDMRKLFHTGLQFEFPHKYGCILRDRSGLATKAGIHVLAGVIDPSYTGEICICLINLGPCTYEITEGDRIAQAILIPEYDIHFVETSKVAETWRGSSGFGSSGK